MNNWIRIVLLAAGSVCAADSASAKPNILFISVDDLRPELKCYGAEHMVTPNLDRLASQGLRFDRAYCQQAVCLPSRISLFTGMRPDSTGVHDLQTKFRETIPNAVIIPQHLAKHGYHTIGMGKVLHDEQWGDWDQWIDTKDLDGVQEYHLDDIVADMEKRTQEALAKGIKQHQLWKHVKGPSLEEAEKPDGTYHDGAMTDLAIAHLREKRDKPFFMTVGYKKPHLPFIAPKKYWDLYPAETAKIPSNYTPPEGAPQTALSTWGELRAYTDIPAEGPVSDEKAIDLIRGYYACVSFVDAQIGRLLAALEEEGLSQNTVVVLWGDHGWKLGEHGMWCKHTNYELDARTPLIIRMPDGQAAGKTTSAMVELIDLYPTLCDIVGIETPTECEGKSLLPILANPATNHRPAAVSQFKRPRNTGGDFIGYSIKVPEGRYTEWIHLESGKARFTEYYDHTADPDENRNAEQDLAPDERARLSTLLHESAALKEHAETP